MRKRILAAVVATAMLCCSGMMVSANPLYDTDYRFSLKGLGTAVLSDPAVAKLSGTKRAWIMQYSISGAPANTITNVIVIKDPGGQGISPDTPMTKGTSIFREYNRNGQNYSSYSGATRLIANPVYSTNYVITGTWNPNIN